MKLFGVFLMLILTSCASKKELTVREFVAPFESIREQHRAIYATLRNRLTHVDKFMQEYLEGGVDMAMPPYSDLVEKQKELRAHWKSFLEHHETLENLYAETKEDLSLREEEEEEPIRFRERMVSRRDARVHKAESMIQAMQRIRSKFIETEARFKYVANRNEMRELDLATLRSELVVLKKSFQLKTMRSAKRLQKQKTKSREIATATADLDKAKRLRAQILELEEEIKKEIEDFEYEVGSRRKAMTGPGLRSHTILKSIREKEKKARELYRLFNSEMDKIDPRGY